MHRPIIKTRARIVKPPGTWLVGLSTFHLAQRTWCYDVIKAFFFTALLFGRVRGGLGPPGSQCQIMPADPGIGAWINIYHRVDGLVVEPDLFNPMLTDDGRSPDALFSTSRLPLLCPLELSRYSRCGVSNACTVPSRHRAHPNELPVKFQHI